MCDRSWSLSAKSNDQSYYLVHPILHARTSVIGPLFGNPLAFPLRTSCCWHQEGCQGESQTLFRFFSWRSGSHCCLTPGSFHVCLGSFQAPTPPPTGQTERCKVSVWMVACLFLQGLTSPSSPGDRVRFLCFHQTFLKGLIWVSLTAACCVHSSFLSIDSIIHFFTLYCKTSAHLLEWLHHIMYFQWQLQVIQVIRGSKGL